ncbi:hypothetical protein [Aureimonas sp. SA4125]|uniref:hypothetical protein n=1 Tax=Aureimonas sp. SA4125 TaxID=2826993 RepID=UPI001CC6C6B0|nr:hypothetical protein [Aureimonas sp. SA4125]
MLDENVPSAMAILVSAHGAEVLPFPKAWKGLKNGALLLRLEERGIDVFVTCDKNIAFQQRLGRLTPSVLPTPKLDLLAPLASTIAEAIVLATPGTATLIDLP